MPLPPAMHGGGVTMIMGPLGAGVTMGALGAGVGAHADGGLSSAGRGLRG